MEDFWKNLKGIFGFYFSVLLSAIICIPVGNLFNTHPQKVFWILFIIALGVLCWIIYAKEGDAKKARIAIFTILAFFLLRIIAGHQTGLTLNNSVAVILFIFKIHPSINISPLVWLSFVFDVGILLAICCSLAEFTKKNIAKPIAVWTGIVLIFGSIIAVVFPKSYSMLKGLWVQIDGVLASLIGNSTSSSLVAKTLTPAGLVGLLSAIAVLAYCFKTKKWNAIFGVLFLIAIFGGAIFTANAVTGHLRTGRWPWEKTEAVDATLEAPAGFEKYQIEIPPGRWEANTQKYSEKGYLRVDVTGRLVQMAFGKNGERQEVSPEMPFETKNAPIGTLVYLWSDSSRSTRVIITTD